ncbi:hypothetical protein HNR44_000448 [Geomicrobium halophilum]|uniref:Spore coat protein CotO n=1 Tax=Geomicrobium halophilum TaxID=549000 RepID=A0A841PIC7_9BACL|nr:CotO family spore coat protein [Geomicrobium halophilum]MBB6448499.1 hypothetical protein [Geomicrobium halophilum]
MSSRRRMKRVQPLLYIDNPNHEPPSHGRTEVEVLYKRSRLQRSQSTDSEEEVPENKSEEMEESPEEESKRRRSFNLSRHLGYDWQGGNGARPGTRTTEQLKSTLEKQNTRTRNRTTRRRAGEHQIQPDSQVKNKDEGKKEENSLTFADKTVKEKTDFLVRMRHRSPITCICKTKNQTWVGIVTAVEEQQFTMQTQQAPYLVTINYDEVTELSLGDLMG